MDTILVTIGGIGLIGFVYWFFLMKRDEAVAVGDTVDIQVDGGYTPAVITVKKDRPVTLNFRRTDPSDCLEEVVLSDFQIKKQLPLNQTVPVTVTPNKAGSFKFSCGMNMVHGTLVVEG